MHITVPEPGHTGERDYISGSTMGAHPEIMTAICDAYSDACDWHHGVGSAIGIHTPNASVTTYLKNSKGEIKSGSVPGSKYFVNNAQEWCLQTKGWALPSTTVLQHCNSDPECDGFIMQNDDTFGNLCKFGVAASDHIYFKLP
jgi:hypothetical protein